MKVLMFGWEFPPFISGGLGTACHGITKGLAQHNVDVTFVLPTKRGQDINTHVQILSADEILFSEDFEKIISKATFEKRVRDKATFSFSPYYTQSFFQEIFQNIKDLRKSMSDRRKTSILDFTGNYGKNLWAEVNAYAVIGEFLGLTRDFDVIHAHDWLTYLAGVAAKKMSGKPLVVHVHATEFDRSGEHINQDVYNIERYGMDNADKIITVSHFTKNIVVNRYGVPPEKVEVVHNAVSKDRGFDRHSVQKPLKEKMVLFLGRVTMQKGPDYFIEAANLVYRKMKNVRFVMVGSGDMLHRIINRMAYLKIADRFHFTGFLKGQSVERIYAMSDLYVMPSVSEPFGISPFEALLYDVPVVISKQSGVSEVLKSAVLVDFWDVQKLADKIIQILKNEDMAREIVDKCRGELQHIAWETAGYKIKNVYESLVR